MHARQLSRRDALLRAGLMAGATVATLDAATPSPAEDNLPGRTNFLFCLNTGTIRGQNLGIVKEVEVASAAGYQAIEPWLEAIERYAKGGGSLPELKRRIADAGLTVESAIAFPEWIVDDEVKRAAGLEQAKRQMDLLAQIGGKRLAAPPAGATNQPVLDLMKAAERYRALLELGDAAGIVPQMELWGFSRNVRLLSEAAFVAIQSGHPKACVLADVFHLYKGGSDPNGLRLLSRKAVQVFHMNDYPADPPRDKINDSYRLFPGDGVAPLAEMLGAVRAGGGGTVVLSIELFSRKYWEQDALEVAKQGLAKLKAAAAKG
jgi:2-keto-myo-inositol isomerase